jgi:glycosidase
MRASVPPFKWLVVLMFLLLPGPVALAAPPVQAWLGGQAVALDWQTDDRQRFSSELELGPDLLWSNPQHNFMSYASSHDTSLFFASLARQRGLASALLLSPGAVQLYYGDESVRRLGRSGSDSQQGTRSAMNWSEHEQPEIAALIPHWQLLGQVGDRPAP